MDESQIDTLMGKIQRVFDKTTNEGVDIADISVKNIINMYSNTKVPVYRFHKGGVVIKKNNGYMVEYNCLECDRVRLCALNNITRKINRGITKCPTCRELDEYKRARHSEFLRNPKPVRLSPVKLSLGEKLEDDKKAFEEMDTDWKELYFRRHMNEQEYKYIFPKIVSIQRGKFNKLEKFEYYPTVSISNQTRFNPYLYDRERDCVEKITDIELRCDNCDDSFISKGLYQHKNKIKVFCCECNFVNNVYKIRSYQNVRMEKVMYQSKFELKFIRLCNENKIHVVNGPRVRYTFKETDRTYKVDFYIPKLKLLVEIKDNHVWHREQVKSGKWDAKLNGVEEYIKKSNDAFVVVFPKNYVDVTKKIMSDYWA